MKIFIPVKVIQIIVVSYVVGCEYHDSTLWKCDRCHYCFCWTCRRFNIKSDFSCPICTLVEPNDSASLDGFDGPVRVTQLLNMDRYLLLKPPEADVRDTYTIVAAREVSKWPSGEFTTAAALKAHVESVAHLPKRFHDSWVSWPTIRVTEVFEKVEYSEDESISLTKFIKYPMFLQFSRDKSLISLGLERLRHGFGRVPNVLIFEFLCCFEENCCQIGIESCCLCGTALCLDHFTKNGVAKCSRCTTWYHHLQLQYPNTDFSIWRHRACGEIRYSWYFPRGDGGDQVDLGSGHSIARDLFDMMQNTLQYSLRDASSFRRALLYILRYMHDESHVGEQIEFFWIRSLNPTWLSCARRFYNLLGGSIYPPLNQYEYNDLVADLMFVNFFVTCAKRIHTHPVCV